jgi:hypothetical protein
MVIIRERAPEANFGQTTALSLIEIPPDRSPLVHHMVTCSKSDLVGRFGNPLNVTVTKDPNEGFARITMNLADIACMRMYTWGQQSLYLMRTTIRSYV